MRFTHLSKSSSRNFWGIVFRLARWPFTSYLGKSRILVETRAEIPNIVFGSPVNKIQPRSNHLRTSQCTSLLSYYTNHWIRDQTIPRISLLSPFVIASASTFNSLSVISRLGKLPVNISFIPLIPYTVGRKKSECVWNILSHYNLSSFFLKRRWRQAQRMARIGLIVYG